MKKIAIILSVIAMAFAVFTVSSFAAGSEPASLSDGSIEIDYYGRGALSKLDNSSELLYAYDAIVDGVESSDDEIDISAFGGITEDEFLAVLDAYRYDHAEHFWLGSDYSVMMNSTDEIVTFSPSYTMYGYELEWARDEFNERIEELTSLISDEATDFEKELFLHDEIAKLVTYDKSYENAHNAYGALVEGYAVCDGYAKALQCVLQRVGIQSFIVSGQSFNPMTETYEGHAWNYVRLGGKYYHVDLTWNDQSSYTFHAYFNVTDEYIDYDHDIDYTYYTLPTCKSTAQNYFTVMGGAFDGYSVTSVAEYLEENNSFASFFLGSVYEASEFASWVSNNANSIAVKMGINSYSISMYSIGGEVLVQLDGYCSHSLTYHYEVYASCSNPGNREYYSCNKCGKYFADSYADYEISQNSIYTPATSHDWSDMIEDDDHIRSAGNCSENKSYWYACANCDSISAEKYFESDEKGDHSYPNGYVKTKNNHYAVCDICGDSTATEPHIPNIDVPTETESQQCVVCEYIISPALNHEHKKSNNIESDKNGHWYSCQGCSEQKYNESAHNYTNDCDSTCDDCGWTRKASHEFTRLIQNYKNHTYVCEICGEQSDRESHFDDDNDRKCDECDRTLKADNNTMSAFKATLTEIFSETRPTASQITLLSISAVAGLAIIIIMKILTSIFFKNDD